MTPPRARAAATLSAATLIALVGALVLTAPAAAIAVDQAPVRTIAWDQVNGQKVDELTVAPDGTIWASEDDRAGTGAIAAFAPGASGSSTPTQVIFGPDTQLEGPYGIALDASGNVWVADVDANEVLEFAGDADGDASPINTIDVSSGEVAGVAIGSDGTIYVADGSAVLEYPPNASGNDAPINTITGLTNATGIALQADGTIVVGEHEPSAIETFAGNSTGDATPKYDVSGSQTQLSSSFPATVSLDPWGDIYFANGASITEYSQASQGNVPPIATLGGASADLTQLQAQAVDSHGDVYVEQWPATSADPNTISVFRPLLTVASISPASGPVSGGQTVTIHGSNFIAPIISVTFGGARATDVTVVHSTTITAVVPAGTVGAVDVTVTEADGTLSASLPGGYTYTATLATTGVDPTVGIAVGTILLASGGILLLGRRRIASARR